MKLTTFTGVIKQLNTSKLDADSRTLLDLCFPKFMGSQRVAESMTGSGLHTQMTSKGAIPASSGRMRRYAGDSTLPGGRYYSVCQEASGRDGGTLVWELMSYWSAESALFPELIDSTVHIEAAASLRKQHTWLDKPFLLLKAHEIESVSEKGIVLGNTLGKVMPLEIHGVEIPGVLDLRTQEAQDWFTAHFGMLETQAGKAGVVSGGQRLIMVKDPPGDFREILPTLLAPSPGGYAFHEAVGAWLRTHGVDGLIFPSARRDCHVTCTDGTIVSFDGWNFVDYRGAGAAAFDRLFGLQPHWLKEHHVGIKVTEWADTPSNRHWRVVGPEEGERKRYDLEWRSRISQRTPSVVWNTRDGGRES